LQIFFTFVIFHLHEGEKNLQFALCLCLLTECTNVTDTQTHTVIVFPYQMAWQYFDGNPLNRGVDCRWGRLKSQFSTNGFAINNCCTVVVSHLRPAFCLMRVLDHQAPRMITHSARPTAHGLALYTITVDCESTLRGRQQNRIEMYALVNLKSQ